MDGFRQSVVPSHVIEPEKMQRLTNKLLKTRQVQVCLPVQDLQSFYYTRYIKFVFISLQQSDKLAPAVLVFVRKYSTWTE